MTIHDHFEGRAHCAQCQGLCQLEGDDLAVTRLIRYQFESAYYAHDGWMVELHRGALRDLLGRERFRAFHERARQTRVR